MQAIKNILILLLLLTAPHAFADESSKFLPDKPGKWKLQCSKQAKTADEIKFNKNVSALAEWFRDNTPLLGAPRGYNLKTFITGSWDNYYRLSRANYGLRADMTFYFHLFLKNGKIWTAELPSASYYSFQINSTQAGTGSHGSFSYFSNITDDPKQEKRINAAAADMDAIRIAFPFREELAPGVHVYENPGSSGYTIIVFNPRRPAYWIPVTVKEMAARYLEYYSLRPSDQILLQELKKELAQIPANELNAPAYTGHNANIVFSVNGRNMGLPLVRFNPDYWDRSLPPSAIQYMTFWYPQMSSEAMEEHLKRFGYPVRSQMLVNQINWGTVSELIRDKQRLH